MRPFAFAFIGGIVATVFTSMLVLAWAGPTSAPPNGNVAAPINVGTTDQVKNAGLALNSLAIFGNQILSGTSRYLNFGTIVGSTGYGFRDNGGTLEFKNSSGSWRSFLPSTGVQSITFADGTTLTTASTGITANITVSCAFGECTATCPSGYSRTGCNAQKITSSLTTVTPSGSNACRCQDTASNNTCYAYCAK